MTLCYIYLNTICNVIIVGVNTYKYMENYQENLSLDRIIEAQLLLLLGLKPSHGYEIIQRLNEADFAHGEIEPATVYRHLRRMDKEGLVQSHWEAGSSGPGRRLYALTDRGQEVLKLWSVSIKLQTEKLQNFLRTYAEFKKPEPSGGDKS